MNYYEIPSLSNLYLEDSYVLSIHEEPAELVFTLEAVLTESHPKYEKPREGEVYCYKRISLIFINVEAVEWLERSFIDFAEGAGDFDYGNIDIFFGEDSCYTLSGDWGKLIVKGKAIEVAVAD